MVKVIQPLTATHAIGPRCDSEEAGGPKAEATNPERHHTCGLHRHTGSSIGGLSQPGPPSPSCTLSAVTGTEWRRREGDRPDALPQAGGVVGCSGTSGPGGSPPARLTSWPSWDWGTLLCTELHSVQDLIKTLLLHLMSDTADSDSSSFSLLLLAARRLDSIAATVAWAASTSTTASATSWSGNRITAVQMVRRRDLECAEWAWRCGGLGSHDLQQANWRPESRCCGRRVSQQRMGKAETERGDDAMLVFDWTTTRRPS
ncbi:hypothetical protein IQ07DRAFT_599953 [Pyrenochaeta sp. DS3sAY3a]|nr:hypothetical protein IQ07DRAFT_599953 [Pyrenochaeta sp. DS3sAY3a]